MISPPVSYDQSPAAIFPEDEDAFWQLFDGSMADMKFDGARSESECPRTLESFLAAYATPAPSSGAPATPQVTPTLPPAAAFPTPFTPAPAFFSASPEAGKQPSGGRELKRQRNTEASARFRLRKKQRENELESHAKHLEDEVVALRAEKSALERQVKVLLEVLGNVGRERRADEGEEAPTPPPQ
ncbi:hypothetical protein CC85DRAFT_313845 [Cutaneotrichosporon oleaginosum]|uniref:BZIP domain-containing protein n=1 Tax=Cutaneotrichosporon oleaginosum TaxID=879819 RepID=A0A0J1AW04_9TREE|nr:uncharacterized protein CC85DRAFT_313845 [Cutaneotrichosporon oleaginosum]KLT39449.1 hypothetical protein CC85DRAFT_313845 [Cutaneotrichosporon oleaginosum]TXT09956.1 hypothetical protein COLE_03890 [Cutaneotrichosporon oleaginosum]